MKDQDIDFPEFEMIDEISEDVFRYKMSRQASKLLIGFKIHHMFNMSMYRLPSLFGECNFKELCDQLLLVNKSEIFQC